MSSTEALRTRFFALAISVIVLRTSRNLRMDRASSGKSDPPCFKQDQTTLFVVQRRRKRAYCFIPTSRKSPFRTPRDF
jgi:hypothetical protein